MNYLDTLKIDQRVNMNLIIAAFKKWGIINPFSQAAILSVCSKECEFKMTEEISYKNTPNKRIRVIFGAHFAGISDEELNILKIDDEAFFNHVYGGMYGNKPNQGYFYRGRGFNDVTFEGNYAMLTRKSGFTATTPNIGYNLIDHPELLNKPEVAADCAILYFLDKFYTMPNSVSADVHAKMINDFINLEDAVMGLYRANAGWNTKVFPDNTGGFAKCQVRAQEFYELLTK